MKYVQKRYQRFSKNRWATQLLPTKKIWIGWTLHNDALGLFGYLVRKNLNWRDLMYWCIGPPSPPPPHTKHN